MAQHEQDREDLLREATALSVRAEIAVNSFDENIVIGFRAGGAASLFVGADPVYQFNAAGQLRRGYRDGKLIKAVDGRLFSMRRERRDGQVQLLRSELTEEESTTFLEVCRDCLNALAVRIAAKEYQVIGQVPDDADVLGKINDWLQALPTKIEVAAKPNVA